MFVQAKAAGAINVKVFKQIATYDLHFTNAGVHFLFKLQVTNGIPTLVPTLTFTFWSS